MKLDVIKSEEHAPEWYESGLQFTCTQCGNCCTGGPGYVWISDVEIGRLAEYLKISRKATIEKYCRKIGNRISLKESRNLRGQYDCIFLKETPAEKTDDGKVVHSKRTCTVYPVRPLQCRTWPFWDGLLANQDNWNTAAVGCPGMNRGKKYSKEQIEALRDAKDWPT